MQGLDIDVATLIAKNMGLKLELVPVTSSNLIYYLQTQKADLFFFSSRRRHTRSDRDWSSDVCSSDLFLILEDAITLIWGQRSYPAYQPMAAAGDIEIGDLILSNYDIGLVGIAAVVAVGGYVALNYTRYGRLLTVVIFDRETAAAFGVNVTLVYTVTFIIGAMLGALGGAVMAPKIAVTLGIGVEVIVLAFAVVAIGGMGSIEGALVGALIVGICRAAAVHLVPQIELFVIYGVMALVLMIRPYGLFMRAQPRKI